MASLPLVILPDPRLFLPCEDVDLTFDPIDQWVNDMTETMRHNQGIGLAACQVGIMKRLAIVDVGLIRWIIARRDNPEESPCEGTSEEDSPREGSSEIAVFINPTITWSSEERDIHEEGCLSIPDFRAEVERPSGVRVSYLDLRGETCTLEADDLMAVCLQHEIDHLNGILFISYLSPLKRKRVLVRFKKAELKKKKSASL